MRRVYIIEGNTGEYSDRTNWLVKAYLDENAAMAEQDRLTNKLKEFGVDRGFEMGWAAREKAAEKMRNYDDQFRCDYTGTWYTLLTVDLVE